MTELYIEFERISNKYSALQKAFTDTLLEKERLFMQTLPGAIRYDKDKVQTTADGSPLEDYVVNVDTKELDAKLARYRSLLDDWKVIMEVKEAELRKSKDIYSRIYVLRYLDNYSVARISRILHYNRQWIYKKIKRMWQMATKSDNTCDTMTAWNYPQE